jgi:two-component system cell cycle sensor histidine kinase/response regulator CckA
MESTEHKNKTLTFLFVDDEDAIRDAFLEAMAELGIVGIVAQDGQTAIRIYEKRKEDIDLIILDLSMPGLNGLDTYRVLRELNPHVKVVLSSGYDREEATEGFEGLAGFLQKPFRWQQFMDLADLVLG